MKPFRSCVRTLVVRTALLVPAALALAPLPGVAQAPQAASREDGVRWRDLSAAQREALAPLEREWAGIDAPRKQKWIEIAARYPSMPAAERKRLQDRMADWTRLTPAQRGQARLNYQETREVPSDDRRAKWEAYQSLPSEERRQLAARAAAQPNGSAAPRRGTPVPETAQVKSNIVPNPALSAPPRAVAPTVVQAKPGATTSLMSDRRTPPSHQQTGLPKIAATPGFVDNQTLLPKRGPQGAAVVPPRPDDDDGAPKKPAR